MKWGLTQGMIGRKLASLSPSATAVGPNTYLSQQDFLKMLGAAFVVHFFIFAIAGLFSHERVTNIPVRALSFKLGDQDRVASGGSSGVGVIMNQMPAAPVMSASGSESWHASPSLPTPKVPRALQPTPTPMPVVKREPVYTPPPVKAPKVIPITEPVRTTPLASLPSPAIAPSPQQYVREVGAANPQAQALAPLPGTGLPNPGLLSDGSGMGGGVSAAEQRVIRDRYEQQISGWIQQHKLYPAAANGREGRTVVRVRIDRSGAVRYYAIEESSGLEVIDAAAVDMIRRANPVPAVPDNYPSGSLIEFLIPITFRAPQ